MFSIRNGSAQEAAEVKAPKRCYLNIGTFSVCGGSLPEKLKNKWPRLCACNCCFLALPPLQLDLIKVLNSLLQLPQILLSVFFSSCQVTQNVTLILIDKSKVL